MTKKILHSPDNPGGTKEFLVPVKNDAGFKLVGLKTGSEYKQGMVVYTGKELSAATLKEKAELQKIEINSTLFESYLAQLPEFKISKMVGIKNSSEFCLEYV
jgi:hypothetical protein